jgi:hypothetical protein
MSTVAIAVGAGEVSPETVASFFQEIILEYHSFQHLVRRATPREPVSIPVQAVMLDDDMQAVSPPFHMVTRDISSTGVGLFHTEMLERGLIQLEFSSPVTEAVLKIVGRVEHCTPCGRYFIVGCNFQIDATDDDACG